MQWNEESDMMFVFSRSNISLQGYGPGDVSSCYPRVLSGYSLFYEKAICFAQ